MEEAGVVATDEKNRETRRSGAKTNDRRRCPRDRAAAQCRCSKRVVKDGPDGGTMVWKDGRRKNASESIVPPPPQSTIE